MLRLLHPPDRLSEVANTIIAKVVLVEVFIRDVSLWALERNYQLIGTTSATFKGHIPFCAGASLRRCLVGFDI